MSRSLPWPPLLLLTDRHQAAEPLADLAGSLFEQGLRWLSLREKDLDADELARLLTDIQARARPHGAVVGLHGELELAVRVREAGGHFAALHLPDGADAVAARHALGADILIGRSQHQPPPLLADEQAAALDYVTLSPIHATASKPGYGPVVGLDALQQMAGSSPVPVIGLGGITSANLANVMATGAAGVAVMGALMRNPDSFVDYAKSFGIVRAHAAVSVLPVRDAGNGRGVEVLVIRRNSTLAFGPGAIAFPGGRVDPADGPAGREETRRVAALRELAEECGLSPPGNDPAGALVPFCRFITPLTYPRRFDTWFYLLPAPPDFTPVADGGEVVEASWASPVKLLEDARAGTITLMFATWLILDRLSRMGTVAALMADAGRHRVVPLTAQQIDSDECPVFRISSGMGFSLTELRFDTLGKT